jgi:hypothetical protein
MLTKIVVKLMACTEYKYRENEMGQWIERQENEYLRECGNL